MPPGRAGTGSKPLVSLEALQAELKEQQEDNARLTEDVERLQAARFAAERQLEEDRAELVEARAERGAREEELQRLQTELERIKCEAEEKVSAERAAAAAKAAAAAAAVAESESRVQHAETAMRALEVRAAAAEAEAAAERNEKQRTQRELDELVERSLAQEALRRQLHEALQTLRGNIRVFCRVRPPSAGQTAPLVLKASAAQGALGGGLLELLQPAAEEGSGSGGISSRKATERSAHQFQFDHVFTEAASQADVFEEVAQLTQSALDGHSVCIFAYGQTGSGKTHSMVGPSLEGEGRGVVPRAVAQAFSRAAELGKLGWEYAFHASFLEIYNEELRDLHPNASTGQKLKVVDNHGTVSVPGLGSAPVSSTEEVSALLDAAAKARATCATACNDQSSRSHYIFRLSIRGNNPTSSEAVEGELNLVDLAGSERIKESQVSGAALTEAKAINKSLSSLGDVVAALASNARHVPFRNSKLTHLLQNALSGSSKTLMFVNVSPLASHHGETLSSLRFAQKANGCQISQKGRGKP